MSDTLLKPRPPAAPLEKVSLTEEQKQKPIGELLDEVLGPVPPKEWDTVPHDGAENHDHYLHGSPRKDPA